MKTGKERNETRQNFLLSFFNDTGYAEKNINGFWLVKQWNGGKESWQVCIYEPEAFKNYKQWSNK